MVLPLEQYFASFLFFGEQNPEVYVKVKIDVDLKKHVKPVAVKQQEASKITQGGMKTLTKYSYFESGSKWVKVRVPYPGAHTQKVKDSLKIDFKERSFLFVIDEGDGKGSQFGVPKLHCRILPEACKVSFKQDEVQVTLRKKNEEDNWWSLFKQKATGEVDSD